MHRPSRVSASCSSLVPWGNQLTVIAQLAEQTTIQMQHAPRFSAGYTAVWRGMHKMQVRCEHIRARWSGSERLLLIAAVPWEGTTTLSDLITRMHASLTLLRCLVRGSVQGVIQLCQK